MNITVKPRPEVLSAFTMFCTALPGMPESRRKGIDNLIHAGLVERVPGKPGYRLTAAGEALRAAREE